MNIMDDVTKAMQAHEAQLLERIAELEATVTDRDGRVDELARTADRLNKDFYISQRERDAARMELERFRHGAPIEGDFVCPNALAADAARAALEAATSPVPGLADSGPYTLADAEAIEKHRGKPYARLRATVMERDAAKAELSSEKELTARALESLLNRCPLPEELEPREGTIEWHDVLSQLDKRVSESVELEEQVDSLKEQIDAAKAEVARLREALEGHIAKLSREGFPELALELGRATLALAATDSGAWLAQRIDAETAPLRERIAELEGAVTVQNKACAEEMLKRETMEKNWNAICQSNQNLALVNDSLRQQIVAATNDAARASLRARDLATAMREVNAKLASDDRAHDDYAPYDDIEAALAAAPDSDARLRDLIGDAIQYGGREVDDLDEAVDEVLGVKP